MSLLQSIIYGFLSGLSEFMPASSKAHQLMLLELFGAEKDPVMDMLIHLALLASLFFGARNLFENYLRERRYLMRSKFRKSANRYLCLFVRNSSLALIITYVLLTYCVANQYSFLAVSVFCLINGILLFLPGRLLQSNKNVQHMSVLDSVLSGVFGSLSVFPGFSRLGLATSYSTSRGADPQHALNWALILSFPAIVLLVLFDFIAIFSGAQALTFLKFFGYLLAACFAYLGGFLSISLMRFLSVKIGFSAFSYYSWGMALFAFILYLI